LGSINTSGGPGCAARTGRSPSWSTSPATKGCLHARLLDAVQGRTGTVYAQWLKEQGLQVTVTVEHATLDPFRGYANAIRDELPDAVAVLDAFHVVRLGSTALDEVRRRVQQQTLHRRGHKNDPLCRIRRTLLTGVEHLTDRQRQRLQRWLPVGDPNGEVELAWSSYQRLRSIYHATTPAAGHKTAEQLLKTLPGPGARPTRPDATTVANPNPRLLHHRRGLQRRHRGRQPRHLLAADGNPALPDQAQPCVTPKSRQSGARCPFRQRRHSS
jgi:hypothetical protein